MSATNKKSGWCCNLSPCNLKLKKHLKCDHFELENFQCSWSNLTWLCSYLKYESIGINRKQAQSPQKHSAGIFTEPPKWWARTKFSNFQTSRIFKIQFHIIFELIWIEWTISIFFFWTARSWHWNLARSCHLSFTPTTLSYSLNKGILTWTSQRGSKVVFISSVHLMSIYLRPKSFNHDLGFRVLGFRCWPKKLTNEYD